MSELSRLQHEMAHALRHDAALEKDPRWVAFAQEHITGNARLSPVEQLEIYREQYWLRHTSALVEDFPGVGGILGQADWERLAEAFIERVVPSSYTLRDLGARLPEVIAAADWLPHQALCWDMARLELAYVEVFDAPDSAPLKPERLSQLSEPELLASRLVIAPSVRLLSLTYPVAQLRRALRSEQAAVPIPEPSPQQLVVYRRDLRLWDMPLSTVAAALFSALQRGAPLQEAAELAAKTPEAEAELAGSIGAWFQDWTAKGLICDLLSP